MTGRLLRWVLNGEESQKVGKMGKGRIGQGTEESMIKPKDMRKEEMGSDRK